MNKNPFAKRQWFKPQWDYLTYKDQYRMTVVQAKQVLCCCGSQKGEPMSTQNTMSLHWFATRKVTTQTSAEFAECVKAARVMLAYARQERVAKSVDGARINAPDNAYQCTAACNSCGEQQRLSTLLFSRRARVFCDRCGGTMVRHHQRANYEPISTKEAAEILGCGVSHVRQLCQNGTLMHHRASGRYAISKEHAILIRDSKDGRLG